MNTDNLIVIDLEYIDPNTKGIWDTPDDPNRALWIEFWRSAQSVGNRNFKHKPNKKPRYLRTYHHYTYHKEALYTDSTDALSYQDYADR